MLRSAGFYSSLVIAKRERVIRSDMRRKLYHRCDSDRWLQLKNNIMSEKEKYHPIGVLIMLVIIAFLAYVTIGVISEGLMNIYNP